MSGKRNNHSPVVMLSGGIGGAKLALGCSRDMVSPGDLTVIANTGDDFRHYGLHIAPDIDTLMYTLADTVNQETGWGRSDETWNFMSAFSEVGGDTWFNLGDRDLATHILRTSRLDNGESLTSITRDLVRCMGVESRILPMSDGTIRTEVHTQSGWIGFQEYFVRERCEPEIDAIRFSGSEQAEPSEQVQKALTDPRLSAIIIAPSNPYLSIDPILSLPAIKTLITNSPAPVIAVSPIVAGQSIKGPTAKIMREAGHEVSVTAIAEHYRGLIDGIVIDEKDQHLANQLSCPATWTDTIMKSIEDRIRVSRATLDFASSLGRTL